MAVAFKAAAVNIVGKTVLTVFFVICDPAEMPPVPVAPESCSHVLAEFDCLDSLLSALRLDSGRLKVRFHARTSWTGLPTGRDFLKVASIWHSVPAWPSQGSGWRWARQRVGFT